ncbi:MAG: sigma-54-dependent Fis family transcriptional regulator [Bacteroidales bacterium]|nr:sigma-54-dependent Fis family transcriptional regulator [Bacteroidales bacterium]
MVPARILVIDDNVQILESLRILLKDEFEAVDIIPKPARLNEMLWRNSYDVVMLDMNFAMGETSGNEGIFWLNEIKKRDPLLPVILITAYGDIELAVKAIREGATDFITKPWDPEKLLVTLNNAYRLRKSGQEVKKLKSKQQLLSEDLDREYRMFHGTSEVMTNLMNTVDRVAATDANVLILGENGTGKEVIAREIHRRSTRSEQIFVGVDMGSLSETLFESEMFGHVKGAFTDAREDRTGRFETADEGTLFLDEIGNIPLPIQAKLLQVIQNRELIRVGDQQPLKVDIRLITATNRSLKQMVAEGTFREDLFYRLNTVTIEAPPLRERDEDVVLLGETFLEQYSRKYNKPGLALNKKAIQKLREYPWPGNVRELKHTMERAVILCESVHLGPDDLRLYEGHGSVMDQSFKLDDVEQRTIITVLQKCRGNHSKAAHMLNISRTTLYAKLKKYGI